MFPKTLTDFLRRLPNQARVLDFGSYDFSLQLQCQRMGIQIRLEACDVKEPSTPPQLPFTQLKAGQSELPISTALYDAIVVSHVIEHLPDPIATFGEIIRILKPGGWLYIEAPSERSLHTKSHAHYLKQGFFSFWDDPTHLRPWPPAALYRLIIGYGCQMVDANYIGNLADKLLYPFIWLKCQLTGDHHTLTDAAWRAHQFSCYAIARKPETMQEVPKFNYISFKKA